MASAEKDRSQKILRVGIIQNGRVIEEELFRDREPVSVGTKLKNSIVVASDSFSESATIFGVRDGRYVLQFSESMQGRVALPDGVRDLRSLVRDGLAKRNGAVFALELSDRARGRVALGEVTILFQFVSPPPLSVLPQLPANMRGGFFYFLSTIAGLSTTLLLALFFSGAFQIGSVVAARWWFPAAMRLTPDEIVQQSPRFEDRAVAQEEEEPEAEPEPTEPTEPTDGPPEEVAETTPTPGPTQPTEAPPAVDNGNVEDFNSENVADAMAELERELNIGSAGSQTGGISLAQANSASRAAASTQRGQESTSAGTGSSVLNSTAGDSVGREGGPQGGRTGIAQGVGGGDRAVEDSGTPVAVSRPTIRGAGMTAPTGTGTIDQGSVNMMLTQYSGTITTCYEAALRNNPGLAGSVTIEIEIGPNGLVVSKRMVNSNMGGQVDGCIMQQVGNWFFPAKPTGGSVKVQKTYILNPG